MRFYAGIGSRNTPEDVLVLMTKLAIGLEALHYVLRSGDAKGADKAFQKGAVYKEIFLSKDAKPWAIEEVKKYIPTDRSGFDNWTPYVKGLLARNMMQVLGKNGDQPVSFVLCWAPSLCYTDSSSGGTGYAIRCAIAHSIPVWNMYDVYSLRTVENWVKETEGLAHSSTG